MSVTTTKADTLKDELNLADPNKLADAVAQLALGDMVAVQKDAITQSSASTVVLTSVTALKRAARMIQSVRVTAGAAAAGPRQITDAGGTASTTVCLLSDDGATLTFEAGVTAATIVWIPRSKTSPTADFKRP